VKSQRYRSRAHSTPDFSANVTPAMCRALNGEVWIVTAKIILLEDVLMLTIAYLALMSGASN
jgi:hypothetical protein